MIRVANDQNIPPRPAPELAMPSTSDCFFGNQGAIAIGRKRKKTLSKQFDLGTEIPIIPGTFKIPTPIPVKIPWVTINVGTVLQNPAAASEAL